MIEPGIAMMAIAIDALAADAPSGESLAASIRSAFPDEPVRALRRAIFYAVTDPERRDSVVITRLHDAAMVLALGEEGLPFVPDAPAMAAAVPARTTAAARQRK